MAEPALPILRSVDEFLAWENAQAERYEFVGGVLTLMAGGTENHDLIGINVASACSTSAFAARPAVCTAAI